MVPFTIFGNILNGSFSDCILLVPALQANRQSIVELGITCPPTIGTYYRIHARRSPIYLQVDYIDCFPRARLFNY